MFEFSFNVYQVPISVRFHDGAPLEHQPYAIPDDRPVHGARSVNLIAGTVASQLQCDCGWAASQLHWSITMNSTPNQSKPAEGEQQNSSKSANQQNQVDGKELGGHDAKKNGPGQQEQRDKEQQGGQQGRQKDQPAQGSKNESGQNARR